MSWFESVLGGWTGRTERTHEEEPAAGGREEELADAEAMAATVGELLEREHVAPRETYEATGLPTSAFLLAVLRYNDGRMRQGALVETTGWSKATVSRHLCALERDRAVLRVQVGREKHVFLPDAAPDALSSRAEA